MMSAAEKLANELTVESNIFQFIKSHPHGVTAKYMSTKINAPYPQILLALRNMGVYCVFSDDFFIIHEGKVKKINREERDILMKESSSGEDAGVVEEFAKPVKERFHGIDVEKLVNGGKYGRRIVLKERANCILEYIKKNPGARPMDVVDECRPVFKCSRAATLRALNLLREDKRVFAPGKPFARTEASMYSVEDYSDVFKKKSADDGRKEEALFVLEPVITKKRKSAMSLEEIDSLIDWHSKQIVHLKELVSIEKDLQESRRLLNEIKQKESRRTEIYNNLEQLKPGE